MIVRTILIVAALLAAPCQAAVAEGNAVPRIAGKWTLVSVYEENDAGEDLGRWGNSPEGQLTASADGRFSLLMVGRNVTRIATTAAEQACSNVRSCREMLSLKVICYSGAYFAGAENEISFDIDDSIERGWKGTRVVASVNFRDNEMHFVTASAPSPTGSFYVHLVWQKERPPRPMPIATK